MPDSSVPPQSETASNLGPAFPEKPGSSLSKRPTRLDPGQRFGRWFLSLPVVRDRVPARYRPTLYLETAYNLGTGAFICLFLLSQVVLKTVIDGRAWHLSLLAAFFGGSSLLSPLVSYLGRRVPMKSLVVAPNLLVAALLLATVLPVGGATLFTFIVGGAFVVRVFPRVAEMNMYRVNYPATHRGSAVSWTKAVSAIAAVSVTLAGYWWFSFQPRLYWLLYWLVAALLVGSTLSYARIPVSRRNIFAREERLAPHRAFWQGARLFVSDRRFLLFQFGFALAGFANHMALVYVAQVLTVEVLQPRPTGELLPGWLHALTFETLGVGRATAITMLVGWTVALMPVLLMMVSALLWGPFLDRVNPMLARSVFNTFQTAAFALHAYGGMTLQIWPFVLGSALHAIGNGGGTINWLTGSLYFAEKDRISLYNAVHVCLTGLRGLIAPLFGLFLYSAGTIALPLSLGTLEAGGLGSDLFWLAAGLSAAGAAVMLVQGLTDPGPRE